MRVVTVGRFTNGRLRRYGGRSVGRACKICSYTLREGQRVLRIDESRFAHLPCLREMCMEEPEFLADSEVELEVERLRAELTEHLQERGIRGKS